MFHTLWLTLVVPHESPFDFLARAGRRRRGRHQSRLLVSVTQHRVELFVEVVFRDTFHNGIEVNFCFRNPKARAHHLRQLANLVHERVLGAQGFEPEVVVLSRVIRRAVVRPALVPPCSK